MRWVLGERLLLFSLDLLYTGGASMCQEGVHATLEKPNY